ncbi:MAG: polysaccharide biosynthesis protein [Bacilli bacterium]|nr:polysaccharide biosynthesis protein [Bacilli bacterium]
MKKDITMRKNTFVKGAVITTVGIILTKIMGILYVIPFHSIIGDEGGALYGYAYTIYLFFLSLSSAGIPLAISKIVSEYQTLGYIKAKKRAFVLGKWLSVLMGFICFLLVVLFAPILAKSILGDVVGGNSVEDVTLVIRIIASAILIGPLLSVYRGYFEGHRIMSPPSISQVLEQLFRVLIIIFGSLITLKVFHLSLSNVVGVALFGATVGAFISYFYLLEKYLKNRSKFQEKVRDKNEPLVSDKVILKKIVVYAIPFIMIDFFKSMYNYVDMVSVVKGLVTYANYSAVDAETVYSIFSTWAQKFNMIIAAVSTGIIVSLIPNLTESLVKKDKSELNQKINLSLSMLLYFIVPMTFGICFLSKAVWGLFYGDSTYGASVLSYYIFVGFVVSLFTTVITTLQTLKDYKDVFICLLVGILIKIIFNMSLLRTFTSIGLPPYYGFITATILGYGVSFLLCMILLNRKYEVSFENLLKNFIDVLCGSLLMIFVLVLIRFLVPVYSNVRMMNFLIILFYALMGSVVYFLYAWQSHLTKSIFGDHFFQSISRILLRK